MHGIWRALPACVLVVGACGAALSCRTPSGQSGPAIAFDQIPEAAPGGTRDMATIAGRVTGAGPGQRIVLYARTEGWWVQPTASDPYTAIATDGTWKSSTHLGAEYAALLVDPGYEPPPRTDSLPATGGGVVAVTTVAGTPPKAAAERTLHFSGYDWSVRQVSSDRGGVSNEYDPNNVSLDTHGALRLRISGADPDWTCAEVALTRSLGYGTYTFVIGDTSHLEPSAALSLFTWDYQGLDQGQREMDIEISRWGDPASRNAQFVVQPYYVPANVVRFVAPRGVLTHSMRWEPGRVSMRTVRGTVMGPRADVVAEHVFTSGVPSPGSESVRMSLYVFRGAGTPFKNRTEVVVEKFEYLP